MIQHIAILTNFTYEDPAFSLVHVVRNQITMIKKYGQITPVVVVADGFKPFESSPFNGVTLKYISAVDVTNDADKVRDAKFDDDVARLYWGYKDALGEKINEDWAIITHDMVYTPDNVKHQVAARRLAYEYPNLKWFHWIHSATTPLIMSQERPYYREEYMKMIYEPFPNSKYVFFNNWSKRRIATNFMVPIDMVATVYHPTDIDDWFGLHELSSKVVEATDLLSADMSAIYPVRLDRGKQPEVVLELMARLSMRGLNTRCIIADFASSSKNQNDDKFQYRQSLHRMAEAINYKHLYFTSEIDEQMSYNIPPRVIRELMMLTNIFIIPSRSESYSLITQEAVLTKNLVILNGDFPPFKEIFGDKNMTINVSSAVNSATGYDGETTPGYPQGRDKYFEDKATEIIEKFNANSVLVTNAKIRQERNLKYVWEHYLAPLLNV